MRVLLPADHGSWALVLSPLLLGLLLAPSAEAFSCATGVLAAFLARQPLRLAWTDFRRRRLYPRTRWAAGWAATLLPAALACWALAAPWGAWVVWLAAGLALGLPQLALEFRGARGSLAAEALAALGAALMGGAVALAGGAEPSRAGPAAVLAGIDAAAAVAWVRAQLGKEDARRAAWLATSLVFGGVVGAAWAASAGGVGLYAAVGYAVVQCRLVADARIRGRVVPVRLGMREAAARLIVALSLALG